MRLDASGSVSIDDHAKVIITPRRVSLFVASMTYNVDRPLC